MSSLSRHLNPYQQPQPHTETHDEPSTRPITIKRKIKIKIMKRETLAAKHDGKDQLEGQPPSGPVLATGTT